MGRARLLWLCVVDVGRVVVLRYLFHDFVVYVFDGWHTSELLELIVAIFGVVRPKLEFFDLTSLAEIDISVLMVIKRRTRVRT